MKRDTSHLARMRSRWILLLGICMTTMIATESFAKGNLKGKKPHIVFLISEDPDNYEAHKTIPAFAEMLKRDHNFQVSVLLGQGPRHAFSFPGMQVLSKADLVVIFCRRVALPSEQLAMLRKYLKAGKPIVGLRTANHAFSVREEVEHGHEAWWEFVSDILGSENRGYGPVEPGTDIAVAIGAEDHPILKGISPPEWHSVGNLYLVAPLLDTNAKVLLTGSVENKMEPIAWTRITADKGKVFYTSLGYPDDFQREQFQKLVLNAINWALKK